MNGFKVYLNGKFFDEVFLAKKHTCQEVEDLLIADGYPSSIVIKSFRT